MLIRLSLLIVLWSVLVACQPVDDATPEPTATLAAPIDPDAPPTPLPDDLIAQADAEHALITNVYTRLVPSVVNIEATVIMGNGTDISRGSGFIYDRNGRIITNAHVINNAEEIRVTFNDGYIAPAELMGQDNFSDIAVLDVDVDIDRLIPVTFGDSDTVQVGQRALAIGNPYGLNSSMTSGIVSAVGRQLASAEVIDPTLVAGFQNPRIIQVDSDLTPGNSGGPLLNSRGEVIGVNTAIQVNSSGLTGVGFAVPSNTVARVVPDLISRGEVDYSWIGISTVQSEYGVTSLAEPLGLSVQNGVLITRVTLDSPAAEAGIRGGTELETVYGISICTGGDIVIAVDDTLINNMDELVYYLLVNTIPGDVVTLAIVRNGDLIDIPVTLGQRPTTGTNIIPECGEG